MAGQKTPSAGNHTRYRFSRSQFADEPVLDLGARPRCFPQEGEAGFHGRIKLETADGNAPAHFNPTMPLHELVENGFQRDAMQRIARMGNGFGIGFGHMLF